MSWWFDLKCPVCGHRIGLHSGPNATDPTVRMGMCWGGPTDGRNVPDCRGSWCGWYERFLEGGPPPRRDTQLPLFG